MLIPEKDKIIDRDKPQKLYIQLYNLMKKNIEDGVWPVGSQIPIEEELCKIYEVSKATVRFAVLELVRDGYLTRQQGKGTFVCKRVIHDEQTLSAGFKELMLEPGVVYSTQVLAQTVMMPTDDLDMKLNVPKDKHIIYIKILRLVDNDPVLLQEAYIPYHVCPSLLEEDVAANSLFELFELKYAIPITEVKSFIDIACSGESKSLGLLKDSPVMVLEQHFYSGNTQILYIHSIKRPDRLRFAIEFEKK